MGAATVNAEVVRIYPATAVNNSGEQMGYIASTAKVAQNDKIKITNANTIIHANLSIVTTGASETYTISGNEITLTSATTGHVRGFIYYK